MYWFGTTDLFAQEDEHIIVLFSGPTCDQLHISSEPYYAAARPRSELLHLKILTMLYGIVLYDIL